MKRKLAIFMSFVMLFSTAVIHVVAQNGISEKLQVKRTANK